MKNLKCKGKRVDNNEFVEGFYCTYETGSYATGNYIEETKHVVITKFSSGGISWVEVFPETIELINTSGIEKNIDSAAATINRLKDALNDILTISRDNESSIETINKIEKVAEAAL